MRWASWSAAHSMVAKGRHFCGLCRHWKDICNAQVSVRIACRATVTALERAVIAVMSLQVALVGLMAALLATPALGKTASAHAAGLQLRKPSPAGLPRLPPPVAAAAAALETHRRLPCPAGGGQEAALQAALELVRGTSNASCYQDVACAPGWREASDAVVLLLLASESGAARFCTGATQWVVACCLACAQRLWIANCTAQTLAT